MARIIKPLYDIEYNGVKASSLGAHPVSRPGIPSPEENVSVISVPGRDGVLIQKDGSYGTVVLEVTLAFSARADAWMEKCRGLREWLLSAGNGILRLGDDSGYFYRVKRVIVGTAARTDRLVGELPVQFLCDGFSYLDAGTEEYSLYEVAVNPYALCHPVYKVTASVDGTFRIWVNGHEMSAAVGQNLTIDTDRMMAYREDGTLMNTSVSGDYEGLYLRPGTNTFQTISGFTVRVIPNWRRL